MHSEISTRIGVAASLVTVLASVVWGRVLHTDHSAGGSFLDGLLGTLFIASVVGLGTALLARQAIRSETGESARLAAKTATLERQLAERTMLIEVWRRSTESLPIETMLAELVRLVGGTLGMREVAIAYRDAEGVDPNEAVTVRAAWGFADPGSIIGRAIGPSDGALGVALETGEPVVIEDLRAETSSRAFWGLVEANGTFAVFPIRCANRLTGLLAFTQTTPGGTDESSLSFLRALSAQIGVVLHHAVILDELRAMSTHDDLTGLANRRLLMGRLEREFERARRYNHPLSVLCIDIDHFKLLNDRCGHPTGDEALRRLARLMEGSVRKVDTVARVGGEEFVALLPRADLDEAARVGEKLRLLIAATPLPGGDEQPTGRLTVSVGVAELRPGESIAALLTRGDVALYAAKDLGRDRVVLDEEAGPRPYAA